MLGKDRSAMWGIMLSVVVLLVLASSPVLAVSPGPLLPVEGGGGADDAGDSADPEPQPTPPPPVCAGPTASAAAPSGAAIALAPELAVSSSVRLVGPRIPSDPLLASGPRTSQPAPVLPTGEGGGGSAPSGPPAAPETDCLVVLSLQLIIEAREGRKPDGANASLDELLVPRSALEGGFSVSLPASDRFIGLSDPGRHWDVKATSCTCGGGTAVGGVVAVGPGSLAAAPEPHEAAVAPITSGSTVRLASYPGPVLPAEPGGGGCVGAGGPTIALTAVPRSAAASPLSVSNTSTQRLTAPGPVLPVGGGDGSDGGAGDSGEPAAPEPEVLEPARVQWDADGDITISDPAGGGGTFDCTWTVEHVRGDLTVRTETIPSGEEGRFDYQLTPTSVDGPAAADRLPGSSAGAARLLRSGTWSVEAADLPRDWKLKRSDCSETESETASSASGPNATAGIDPGDDVTCSFRFELLAPKAGPWRAKDGAGSIKCSGVRAVRIPPGKGQNVAFAVSGEGDTISGGGISVSRNRDRPRQYVGNWSRTFEGQKVDFSIKVKLVNAGKLEGRLTAKATVGGRKCTITRKMSVNYRGGN